MQPVKYEFSFLKDGINYQVKEGVPAQDTQGELSEFFIKLSRGKSSCGGLVDRASAS